MNTVKSLKHSLSRLTLWEKMDERTRKEIEKTIEDANWFLDQHATKKLRRTLRRDKAGEERLIRTRREERRKAKKKGVRS